MLCTEHLHAYTNIHMCTRKLTCTHGLTSIPHTIPQQRTKQLVRALSSAVCAGRALHETRSSPHAWSNILWCLTKLGVYDQVLTTHGAHAMALALDRIQVGALVSSLFWWDHAGSDLRSGAHNAWGACHGSSLGLHPG